MAPDISKIVVEQLPNGPSVEEASSQLLMQCNPRRLHTYNVDAPLSASSLSHVIQLPSLEEFWLVAPFHFLDPPSIPNTIFPSLRVLNVELRGDFGWLKLLPKCPVLSVIRIGYPDPDVAQFMETFHSTITGCGMHDRLQELTLWSPDEFKITPQILACNFSFKNLVHFQLWSFKSTPCQTLDLTDADVDLLTNAMPCLITLIIGEEPCSAPSKITFNSLYTISRRCTRLKKLQIHFNPDSFITKMNAQAGSDSGNSGFENPSSNLCSVTNINVGSIGLPGQCNVSYIMALGLMRVFPRLEEVEYDVVEYEYGDGAWEEINSLIGFHQRIRTAFVRE